MVTPEIRRLQYLNDLIGQTLEVIQQRMFPYGAQTWGPFATHPLTTTPWGVNPYATSLYGGNPYGTYLPYGIGTGVNTPFASPFATGFGGVGPQLGIHPLAHTGFGTVGAGMGGTPGIGQPFFGGIHGQTAPWLQGMDRTGVVNPVTVS